MFYLKEPKKTNCTGCQSCKEACPKNAIDMVEDEEGFLYPKKNSNCIECGICEKICPLENEIETNKIQPKVYAAFYKNEQILQSSSSGGAFTAICNAFCDKDYFIFGAEYDNKFKVIHNYIDNIENIDKFRKSKYVQSDINNSYKIIKKMLNNGKKVIFSGTPCQVAGLKSFLNNKEYENLLCIDLICKGVPSPKVWKKYIQYIENKYNSKITKINFREKTNINDSWNSKNMRIELEDNQVIVEDNIKNYYLKGFYNKLFNRPSCKICKFANPIRVSDITIGDCWGYHSNNLINVHKGLSIIIINTQKGDSILKQLNKYMNLEKLDLQFVIKTNAQFKEPIKFNKNRDKFYRNLDKMNFDKLIKKYAKDDCKVIIKRNIKKIVPKKIKERLKLMMKSN